MTVEKVISDFARFNEATSTLMANQPLFHYFSITWHEVNGWECHLTRAYGGTQYVDKFGRHVVDIYSFGRDKDDPRVAVISAIDKLRAQASVKVDERNAGAVPKTIAELVGGRKIPEQSAEDLLKELGL